MCTSDEGVSDNSSDKTPVSLEMWGKIGTRSTLFTHIDCRKPCVSRSNG